MSNSPLIGKEVVYNHKNKEIKGIIVDMFNDNYQHSSDRCFLLLTKDNEFKEVHCTVCKLVNSLIIPKQEEIDKNDLLDLEKD